MERDVSSVRPEHMHAISKDDTEVFILASTEMAAIHVFVLFQCSCNLKLQVLQILKQAHIHTGIKQAYCGHIYILTDRKTKLFPGN